jgi:hypothetical protein
MTLGYQHHLEESATELGMVGARQYAAQAVVKSDLLKILDISITRPKQRSQ